MQSIFIKILPATTTKPYRMKAWCDRGELITDTDQGTREEQAIQAAFSLVCRFVAEDMKNGTPFAQNPWARAVMTLGSAPQRGTDVAFIITLATPEQMAKTMTGTTLAEVYKALELRDRVDFTAAMT